jgi:outer membrane protein assembly factor BamE (lipoprotein component of BamABCDE complex)
MNTPLHIIRSNLTRPNFARRNLIALALTAGLGLGACTDEVATHGHILRTATVEDVRPGAATKQDIRALLGTPSSIAAFDDSVWYYISQVRVSQAFFKPDTAQQQVLVMHFDGGGVLDKIGVLGEEDSNEVILVARETPTAGHKLTFLEQLLGNVGRFTKEEQGS